MKIRLFAAIAGCLVFGQLLQAAPVPASRALEIGKMILEAQPGTKARSGAVRLVWDGEFSGISTKSAALSPAFYVVVRDGGGFVIIAGDDNVTPVLALSDRNEFRVDGMPDNVKWWMEHLKVFVRTTSFQTSEVKARWAQFAGTKSGDGRISGEVSDKVEKLTPEWDQGGDADFYSYGREVFNTKCPQVGGQFTLTGCVATAVAELMAYHSGQAGVTMPTAGHGTVGGYAAPEGRVAPPAYELGTVYLWDQLRTLTGPEAIGQAIVDGKEELLDNLAQLLADVGAALHSEFGVNNTVSEGAWIPYLIPAPFGYNKSTYYAYADHYSPRQWVEKLKTELDRRPLYYQGSVESGAGHAFIFDGYGRYDGADVFHVNFGWSGACNGYYYHDNLDVDMYGVSYSFKFSCYALFDFYPAPESVHPGPLAIDSPGLTYLDYDDSGVATPVPSLGAGGNECSIESIFNNSIDPFSGSMRLVLKDKAGTNKATWALGDFNFDPFEVWSGWSIFPISFDVPYAFGDYVELEYVTDDAPTHWKTLTPYECKPSQIITQLPVYPAAFIQTADAYKLNEWFAFELKNHTGLYDGTVWSFTDPEGHTISKNQSDFEFQFTKKGSWKIKAAVAPAPGAPVTETIVTYVDVK